MNSDLAIFLSGGNLILYWIAALFFARFYQRTQDRFFFGFAISFFLLGFERVALLALFEPDETKTWVYLIRLMAFAVLIYAIVDKNRASRLRRG